jgi:hypothetical protein
MKIRPFRLTKYARGLWAPSTTFGRARSRKHRTRRPRSPRCQPILSGLSTGLPSMAVERPNVLCLFALGFHPNATALRAFPFALAMVNMALQLRHRARQCLQVIACVFAQSSGSNQSVSGNTLWSNLTRLRISRGTIALMNSIRKTHRTAWPRRCSAPRGRTNHN